MMSDVPSMFWVSTSMFINDISMFRKYRCIVCIPNCNISKHFKNRELELYTLFCNNMEKLKAGEFVHLTDYVLKILSQNHITTILDFLQEDTGKLSTLTKLTLPLILAARNDMFQKYSAPVVSGTALLLKNTINKRFLNTGIHNLKTILDGGIPIGYIGEICGLADSGKTQLCLQLAINSVKNSENTVLYIDTKGDFSATRIQKMLDACGYSHKDMAIVMFKIRVIHIWTMDEILEFLKRLKNKTLVIERLSLIIIDSLPCLMFQHLGDDNKIGLTFLNTLVNYSRYLCKEFELVMLCVNIQTRWIDQDVGDVEDDNNQSTSVNKETYTEKRNRCLGRYWQQIPALVMLLEKSHSDSKETLINVSVTKFNNIKCDKKCVLKLSDLGVT